MTKKQEAASGFALNKPPIKRVARVNDQQKDKYYERMVDRIARIGSGLITRSEAKELVNLYWPTISETSLVKFMARRPTKHETDGWRRRIEGWLNGKREAETAKMSLSRVLDAALDRPLTSEEAKAVVKKYHPGWPDSHVTAFLARSHVSHIYAHLWQARARLMFAEKSMYQVMLDANAPLPPLNRDSIISIVKAFEPGWSLNDINELLSSPANHLDKIVLWQKRVRAYLLPSQHKAADESHGPNHYPKSCKRVQDIVDERETNQIEDKALIIGGAGASSMSSRTPEEWLARRKLRKMGILDAGFLHGQTTGLLKEWENLSTALCEDNFVYGYAVATEMISIRVAFSKLFDLLAERKLIKQTQGE